MQTANLRITDFGQKIGGAKKDLAWQHLERLKLVSADALLAQPLSKTFPKPDFLRMFREGAITAEQTIRLCFLYESIEAKPRRSYALNRWAENTMSKIRLTGNIIDGTYVEDPGDLLHSKGFHNYHEIMQAAGFPEEDFNPYPYQIKRFYGGDYGACKGNFIRKSGSLEEVIAWVRENSGAKSKGAQQFSIYRHIAAKTYFITPKGKAGIVLIKDLTREEAEDYYRNKKEELTEMYRLIRMVPEERRDWNRPRTGKDYRLGLDISPVKFSAAIPFRGVEFGNWVSQTERASNLNEAYDALLDLANATGLPPEALSLDGTLALAFGARGSGKAKAHYEPFKRVINLTKKKGAGSLAHEWFHALDNYLSIIEGSPLCYASDTVRNMQNEEIAEAFRALNSAIGKSDYKIRSGKIDELKSKPYWATKIEMNARAFEMYVIRKLSLSGYENDYLANTVGYAEYSRPELYPYPTTEEIEVFAPLFDRLLSAAAGIIQIPQRKTA
jgi:hypothetical protein